ncbi:Uncharacterised protein [BD1-7 clade bacterium]|uniref:Uncharacterized protein n=1 Tax=BD1-7 clade bacterium TaxID=2029982 RepID=A0A5S9QI27_9GAMM|nr:Uncharacterised protein [BD1-7 clade bacterium]
MPFDNLLCLGWESALPSVACRNSERQKRPAHMSWQMFRASCPGVILRYLPLEIRTSRFTSKTLAARPSYRPGSPSLSVARTLTGFCNDVIATALQRRAPICNQVFRTFKIIRPSITFYQPVCFPNDAELPIVLNFTDQHRF